MIWLMEMLIDCTLYVQIKLLSMNCVALEPENMESEFRKCILI